MLPISLQVADFGLSRISATDHNHYTLGDTAVPLKYAFLSMPLRALTAYFIVDGLVLVR